MATITVLKFPTAEAANDALKWIRGLQEQQLIQVHDASIVSWPVGKKIPNTRHLVDLVGDGALGETFWFVLFGVTFFTPLFGPAVGFGALGGLSRDYGIDDDFIKRVSSRVTAGAAAIFLMTSEAVIDRVADAMKNTKCEIIATNLSEEQERNLREAFARE